MELQFQAVSKSYQRGPAVLLNFSFDLKSNQCGLIVGANGCGKTTLLKLAGGFIRPDSGQVLVQGKPAHRQQRAIFGVMLGNQLLYPSLTVRQNLVFNARLFSLKNLKGSVTDALKIWGLNEMADQWVEKCSNGQRSLLALARATLHSPPILLLDEPTAYLDEQNRKRLKKFLSDYPGICLITSQDRQLNQWNKPATLHLSL